MTQAKFRASLLILAVTLLFTMVSNGFGQTDVGGLTGTIKDSSGAVIPDAQVTLTNDGTGIAQKAKSSSTGVYVFDAVYAGTYTLATSKEGFETSVNRSVLIHIQQKPNIDVIMTVGTATQVISVTAAAPLLQSQNAEIGQTITGEEVNNLPLEGRDWTSLTQLAPGVTTDPGATPQSHTYVVQGVNEFENEVRLNGMDDNQEVWSGDNNTIVNLLPPPDAIQEFRQQNGDMSAEFGHSTGGIINASIKSGTNAFHGDLWEYVRNTIFNATDTFAKDQPRPAYHQNVFGGTVGGPVSIPRLYNGKNKTFFFFDYQGSRINTPNNFTSSVPTNKMRASNFTNFQDYFAVTAGATPNQDALGRSFPVATYFDPATTRNVAAGAVDPISGLTNASANAVTVRDPFFTGGSVAGIRDFTGLQSQLNILPAARLDPNAIKLLSLYPTPTVSTPSFNNYAIFPSTQNSVNQYDVRIDEVIGANDVMYGVYDWSHNSIVTPASLPGLANGQQYLTGVQKDPRYAIIVGETHTFSSSLTNEAHVDFSNSVRTQTANEAYTLGIPAQFGIGGVPQNPGNGGLPELNINKLSGIGVSGYLPTLLSMRIFEVMDDVTKLHGSQSFKAGVHYEKFMAPIIQPPAGRGSFYFSGNFSDIPNAGQGYSAMADLLLAPMASTVPNGINNVGGLTSFGVSKYSETKEERFYFGSYFQDDWKATSNLTLNLGLRWDFFQPFYDARDQQANFIQSGGGDGPSGTLYIPRSTCNQNLTSPSFNALASSYNINIACSNRELGTAQYNNFSPRIGFAYRITPQAVVRAGYGIAYGGLATTFYGNGVGESYPFAYTTNYNAQTSQNPLLAPGSTQTAVLENALSTTNLQDSANVPGAGATLQGRQYHSQSPYTQTYNLTTQYQFTQHDSIQAAYVGNVGRHLIDIEGNNQASAIAPPGTNEYDPTVTGHIPFPELGFGNYSQAVGSSNYNSAQVTYTHQASAGLTVNANYTFAKCFTDDGTVGNPGVGHRAPWLPGFGIAGDYGLCNSDVRHVVHASGTYALPFGRGRKFAGGINRLTDAVIGGWTTNYIFTYQSGAPFTVGCLNATTQAFGCNANVVPGQYLYAAHKSVQQWLNPNAFSQPVSATTVGQTDFSPLGGKASQVAGPGLQNLDLSFFKEVPIEGSVKVQFRAEAFNVGNWVSYGTPQNLGFNNPTQFSNLTYDVEGPRIVQLALKLFY